MAEKRLVNLVSRLSEKWEDTEFIAFDLETSGQYPIAAHICEIAAVKWRGGKIVENYQQLVRPPEPMNQEVIRIHHITNEMVEDQPSIDEVLPDFHKFIQTGVLLAHHAPFDLGFLTRDFERLGLRVPTQPVICTSLLSRSVVPESYNHKLKTLIQFFGIEAGDLHRALEDARCCMLVGLRCFRKVGAEATVDEILKAQGKALYWEDFSMKDLAESELYGPLVTAAENKEMVSLIYDGGSKPGKARKVYALGIVRNPQGDFLVGREENQQLAKRYYLDKISESTSLDKPE